MAATLATLLLRRRPDPFVPEMTANPLFGLVLKNHAAVEVDLREIGAGHPLTVAPGLAEQSTLGSFADPAKLSFEQRKP